MKLPAVWIFAALALGIAAAGVVTVSPTGVWLPAAALSLVTGFALLTAKRPVPAFALGLIAWFSLGGLAAGLESRAVRPDLVTSLIADGRLDPTGPLRWSGRLRLDPERLPWGIRYTVDLEHVERAEQPLLVSGGMRISYFRLNKPDEPLPALRAGDRVEALVQARVPKNFGNPGAFDYRGFLAREDIHLTASLSSIELLRKLDSPAPTVPQRLAHARGLLLNRLDALYATAPDRDAVLRAMLLGDRSFIDRDQSRMFQQTAVYHVLVLAGLHVAALAAFVLWAGRRLRFSLAWSTLVTLAVLAVYVAVVQNRPPILRAALMAGIFLCARLFFRRVDLLNTTALAALILLAARPSALSDPSFQLSFIAVGTIGALALPWIERTSEPPRRALRHLEDVTRDPGHPARAAQFRLDARMVAVWIARKLPRPLAVRSAGLVVLPSRGVLRLWDLLVLSLVIQAGMLPMLALYFHRVSLAGPVVNIPAVVLTGLIVPVGFVMLAASWVSSAIASALAKCVGALVTGLIGSVSWFAGWHGSSYRIPGPPALLIVAFFTAFLLLAFAARGSRKKLQLAAALVLVTLAIAVAISPFPPRLRRGKLEITVLDVGQGDSIFAAFPGGRTMLIDGGGSYGAGRISGMRTGIDIGEEVVSPYLWSRRLKRLDVVALTHAHGDHLDGLNAVLENFRVGELWIGHDVASPAFRGLIERARRHGVRIVHHTRGDTFAWGGVTGSVLWPDNSAPVTAANNNNSLVLRLQDASVAALLPGDIERRVEDELVADGTPLESAFLKVPHHGSKTSSSPEFLGQVQPRAAAISVGETNPFGQPSPDVLERLAQTGVRVYRTDLDGAVTFLCDDRTMQVTSFLVKAANQRASLTGSPKDNRR